MQTQLSFKLLPEEAANSERLHQLIAAAAGVSIQQVNGYYFTKRSIDARSRQPWVQVSLIAFINEPFQQRRTPSFVFKEVHHAHQKIVIIGAGPAGLFAALRLIEFGIQPIIIERGKDVRSRRRDLANLNKEGIVNPESNYCFGEGGAGTYSDGKLYTRSNKRGDIDRILQLFVHFGADERILFEAHPHIGTNKLPQIITAMREQIVRCGGEFHFEQKLTGLQIVNGVLKGVITAKGDSFDADGFILATGHSARDVFHVLQDHNILLEAKPFALGVRVEHPQSLIDQAQYHCTLRDRFLPPASYGWVEQVEGKGVFSFCMCPGGIIAPAATAPDEIVVNGWSPSKRNNPYANSGIVVSVEPADIVKKFGNGTLSLLQFQQSVEQVAFRAGGGQLVAPAQRLVDFCEGQSSSSLPACSYLPGLNSVDLKEVLPPFIQERLRAAFRIYGKKMRGYYTNEAIVVAPESRTSSPVRIPRDAQTLAHPQVSELYPCGEGAGYAGGIVSAAMDGEKVAAAIAHKYGLYSS